MREPLVLYSTNTLLAYRINQQYYGEIHYVWCSPFFSAAADSIDVAMPPSSTPCDICRQYLDDVQRQDQHSSIIRRNREGIKRGLDAKLEEGVITPEQFRQIEEVVSDSSLADFRPLLYIIPYKSVRRMIRPALPHEKAHPFSPEYVIERLPRLRFDVLDWSWR
ncbi:MAG TPA: hypothetical protein VLE27_09200 [Thermoanaerobaculia bacterium]|nr:hypothetical protein [Thermoanaerobaculia bacterium]